MQVVAPELLDRAIVPPAVKVTVLVEKAEDGRGRTGSAASRQAPSRGPSPAQRRRRPTIGGRARQAKAEPPIDLDWPQMTERVEIEMGTDACGHDGFSPAGSKRGAPAPRRSGRLPCHPTSRGFRRSSRRRRKGGQAPRIGLGSVPRISLVPIAHRLGPLGRVAQCHAGDAHDGRLLGDAARIRDHRLGVPDEIVEFEIGLRLDEVEIGGKSVEVSQASSPCADAPGKMIGSPRVPSPIACEQAGRR